jgi:hypothetical protein
MTRYWTCYWQQSLWRDEVNKEFEPIDCSLSNTFRRRGVSRGDVAYIVSLADGKLFLGGRLTVRQIVSRSDAKRILQTDNLYRANDCIIDQESGTSLHLRRRLASELSRQLQFISKKSQPNQLCFVSASRLDGQAIRGIRELTQESAAILDRIIQITDRWPRPGRLVTVTKELLRSGRAGANQFRLPEEVPSGSLYSEGDVRRILVNRWERDPRARQRCIEHHGTKCVLCGFDFVAAYGEFMAGFIHVPVYCGGGFECR